MTVRSEHCRLYKYILQVTSPLRLGIQGISQIAPHSGKEYDNARKAWGLGIVLAQNLHRKFISPVACMLPIRVVGFCDTPCRGSGFNPKNQGVRHLCGPDFSEQLEFPKW